jgi:hypothetical protein
VFTNERNSTISQNWPIAAIAHPSRNLRSGS